MAAVPPKKPGSSAATRTRNLTDKARNEQQKSVLLREVARIRDEQAQPIRDENEKLIKASKKVYRKAVRARKAA
ncbi:MAG TPA: hypothetical protein VN577_00510 [Terriglobales bacterium]|nr:hypothetical protein [Terriglobales bacterium]